MFGLFSFKNPRFRLVFIIAVAFILVALAVVAGYAAMSARGKSNADVNSGPINAPALVGRDIITVKEAAKHLGLEIEIDQWVSSKVYSKNYIVTQKPLPGKQVKKGDKIVVKVSKGKSDSDDNKLLGQSMVTDEDPRPLPDPPVQPPSPLSGKIVVIDPGHQRRANLEREPIGPGAKETKEKVRGGATGVNSRIPEYEVVLEISKSLESVLETYGIKVVMLRETHDVNISNAERAEIANSFNADLFIRIHADGDLNPQRNGISTLYPASNKWTAPIYEESLKAARIVQKSMIETTGRKDNGIVERNDISGFNWSKVPVILIETGFLTNPEDDRLLNDTNYQNLLASGIGKGIVEYLKTSK